MRGIVYVTAFVCACTCIALFSWRLALVAIPCTITATVRAQPWTATRHARRHPLAQRKRH